MTEKLKRRALGTIAVITLAAAAGCASNLPPAPKSADGSQPNYLIGPGDNVNIIVWRNPELSMSVPVRPDGMVTTPLVEDVPASNKTPTELARDLEKALSKYIQSPVVTVIVTGFVGPYSQQIRVVGQAARPQALSYRSRMTLMDVMIAVGGTNDFAAGNRAILLRSENNQEYGIRIDDLLKKGDLSANVEMRPGDVIVIPESWF
ncbi:MAG: sugar ABC transporter substrate-binding protein [Burkholderiaceae bacterium]|nr:MAG: sugar ABC transporter substrate-binding protein [Burkholderiaceae bacterium]